MVLQPVTVRGGQVRVHDVAAHLVFSFEVGAARPAVPDRVAFQAIVDDLRKLKADLQAAGVATSGTPLGVHPGFHAAGFDLTARLRQLLVRHTRTQHVNTMAFMGIRSPEPWFFFAVAKVGDRFVAISPKSIAPLKSQMLGVGGVPVVPAPKNTQFGDRGVATAQLFGNVAARLDAAAIPSGSGSSADVKLREIADVIANPQRSHVLNTDCVSCHTESTRRRALNLGAARDELRYAPPAGLSGVDERRLPQSDWNVRNFGWFPRGATIAETVTLRTANEAAESAEFINREYTAPPATAGAFSGTVADSAGANAPDTAHSISNALTLVMKAKSAEDARKLKSLIERLQAMPPADNPIRTALDRLGIVHDARFVFLGEDQFAVITTYDDDFESYVDAFVREIGPVFDQLLVHMADAPPLPVRDHPEEFLEYVRKRDLTCIPPFYSAYPKLRAKDVLTLQREAAR
ncbi:MAG: hypothetical protein J0M17_06930 [Planctomycetes bacterium]|nr:hypothetical protein [Planctomycetota bacterium]